MVAASPYQYDFWSLDHPTDIVQITYLLPNGIIILLRHSIESSLSELKEDLWEEAERNPLFGHLGDKSMYVISAITRNSNKPDEISDESKRLCDVQPFCCLLRVTAKLISENNNLDKNISTLLGNALNEFKTLKSPEVNDFRYKTTLLGEDISQKRLSMSLAEKISYQFPPRLSNTAELPAIVRERLKSNTFVLVAKFQNSQDMSFTLCVPYDITPSKLLENILTKKCNVNNQHIERLSDYIMKVCGRDEYIFGEYPIIQFLYFRETISDNLVPTVVVRPIRSIEIPKEKIYEIPADLNNLKNNQLSSAQTLRNKNKTKHLLSWDIDEMFKCTINEIQGLNYNVGISSNFSGAGSMSSNGGDAYHRNTLIGVQVGLFHGGKSLCQSRKTCEVPLSNDGTVSWKNETLEFDLKVNNIPRAARLCIVVYETSKNYSKSTTSLTSISSSSSSNSNSSTKTRRLKDSNKDSLINPLSWANTTVFDYKNQMKNGAISMYTWTYVEESQSEDLLHPLGSVEQNPRTDECATLVLSFHNYAVDNTVIYPSEDTVVDYAKEICDSNKTLNRDSAYDDRNILDILVPYMHNERLNEIHEQERNAIWAKRYECLAKEPKSLPCLLHCVEWNDRNEVAEMTRILRDWPILPVERALELLDYAYADQSVRRYAVKCLASVKDEELLLYLLQLVQAMKHESYLYSDLVEFLLIRALKNQRIGHYLFWHLRSEINISSTQIRFGLILEAYLKGSQEHIVILLKQMECLDKLKLCSEMAKKGNKDKGRSQFQKQLQDKFVKEALSDVISPLNPSFRCKTIRAEKCKVMDSKMRPLWMVYENADTHGDDIYVIFKNGDDLRQDMLTLQMLRIMDNLWKQHGYDFRMNTYNCISMERRLGMIEIVLNAETIANIQKLKGMFSATSPFKKGSLLAWIKENNTTEDSLKKAIQEFTLSCAGYCVATYVLGVADRHSDNIMVKKTGQLFHIDFGHILGHFKEKFGFRRERVPFVLTHDFVYVINKGHTDKDAADFKTFQKLCEKAFLILREHGCLILSLFAMMISTGLPELSSEKDLNYLRETLVLDLSENEALEHFRSKFSEALVNSWKTSLNWASHNISKNTKQ